MEKLQEINENLYNGNFMKSMPDQVLIDIINNNIDFIALVKSELISRGLDTNGKLVGTAESTKIHKND